MTIISLNIANYDDHPNWEKRKIEIFGTLIMFPPDIICLQEVRFNPQQPSCRNSYQNAAEELLSLMQKAGFFTSSSIITSPAMFYPDNYSCPSLEDNVIWEGKSIITSRNILEHGNYFLTRPEDSTDKNRRSIFWCRMQTGSGELVCANLHWGLDEAGRLSNARETALFAERFADTPLVIIGDFNCDPDGVPHQILSLAGLRDVWLRNYPDKPGYTFPAEKPRHRYDQVWVNDHLFGSMSGPYVVSRGYMSDHKALMVDLNID